MADVLSQDEIDQLLQALNTGELSVSDIMEQTTEKKKIRVYDFRRPNKFSKEQLRTMEILHENLCRYLSSYLAGFLRIYCQVNIVSVEELTYYEFMNSLPEPVVLGIMDFQPMDGKIVVEIAPNISYAMIDRVLGGSGRVTEEMTAFSEIELALMERILRQISTLLQESWANVAAITPKLERIETNAQFAQIIAPNETAALITLMLKIGEAEGMVNICIPHVTIEPISDELTTRFWFSNEKKEKAERDEVSFNALRKRIESVQIPIRAILGESTISIGDFMQLSPGDIIQLDESVENHIKVMVGDITKFYGKPGLRHNHMAVKITDVIYQEEDTDE